MRLLDVRKYFLFTIFMAVISITAFSFMDVREINVPDDEVYKVIKVTGRIEVAATGTLLKTGDELTSKTSLKFLTTDARAAVISPDKGRFIISGSSNNGASNLVPAMNSVETRGGPISNIIHFQRLFEEKLVLLDQLNLVVSKPAFPMNETRYFFVEYTYNEEIIYKKLPFNSDSLIIDPEQIFVIDSQKVDILDEVTMDLYYYNEVDQSRQFIASMKLLIPELTQLKTELKVILDAVSAKKYKSQVMDVKAFLTEFYASPEKTNLTEFLEKHFGLSVKR